MKSEEKKVLEFIQRSHFTLNKQFIFWNTMIIITEFKFILIWSEVDVCTISSGHFKMVFFKMFEFKMIFKTQVIIVIKGYSIPSEQLINFSDLKNFFNSIENFLNWNTLNRKFNGLAN